MNYPKTVVIDHPKLKELLRKKTDLVLQGREMSQDIEDIEKGNEIIDKQIQEIEAKVDLKEFEAEAEATTKEMEALMNRMNEIQGKIYAKLKRFVPPELGEKYDKNKKLKEKLENDRNKIALKVQKIKDLIIPLTQKVAEPLLKGEYEDFSDVRLENNEIVIDIFSHLDEWKKARKKKLGLNK